MKTASKRLTTFKPFKCPCAMCSKPQTAEEAEKIYNFFNDSEHVKTRMYFQEELQVKGE